MSAESLKLGESETRSRVRIQRCELLFERDGLGAVGEQHARGVSGTLGERVRERWSSVLAVLLVDVGAVLQ